MSAPEDACASIPLSALCRRILSALEEAGDDDVAALLNGGPPREGVAADIYGFSTALVELVRHGLVVAARERDAVTRHWRALPPAASSELFESIHACLLWDDKRKHWRWVCGTRLRVLLTDEGRALAERILAGDGIH
jgi:hypothetical protein